MFILKSHQSMALELGSRLRMLRLAQNISQHELALRAGVALSSIRRLEAAGQGTLLLVMNLAQILNAQGLDELFVMPQTSVADLEQRNALKSRQRARRLKTSKE